MSVTPKIYLFTPKGHSRVCWVICIVLKLQCTAIDKSRIDTTNTIDIIDIFDCIDPFKDNQYDQSDWLTLQTSPTQLYHCCFLFRFAWLIKLGIIFLLHPVSYCWYVNLCFLFSLCLPLNRTVVPTAKVVMLYQRVMAYYSVYHGQLFLPVFLLLTEPSSYVPGDINCDK